MNVDYEEFHKNTSRQTRLISKSNFTYRIIFRILEKYIDNKTQEILDIGSGAGTIALYLAAKGNKVVGLDISKTAIEASRKSAKLLGVERNLKFEVMNFPEVIPNYTYDLVTCFEVIEHLENDKLAFKQIYKLLDNRGIALISTPSANAVLYRLNLAKKFDSKVGHLRRYTLGELKKLAKNANFEILEIYKTEGVIRNFLFLNPFAGKLLRYVKGPISGLVTFFDNISLRLFGESNLFIILRKP